MMINEIVVYGLKGMAAYAEHALVLGQTDEEVFAIYHSALAATTDTSKGLMDYVGIAMEIGKIQMQMVRRGDFPAYRQIVHGGKRFWAGRDIKAWLAGQRTPTPAGPDNHVVQDGGEVSS